MTLNFENSKQDIWNHVNLNFQKHEVKGKLLKRGKWIFWIMILYISRDINGFDVFWSNLSNIASLQ